MSWRISILDKSPVAVNETAADALARTLSLAKQAEALGFHRFWIAEHHNTAQLASPSPELLIAWILGQTKHIRVGSGGVMLQHYSPYKVAENFNVLASLAPGRVDLGVGKAPGGLPLSTRALQVGLHQDEKGDFADQLTQLNHWLTPSADEQDDSVKATPLPSAPAEKFLLGASVESALLAAKLGWNFVFAAHLNGDVNLLREVLETWRAHSALSVTVAVQAIVAPTQAQADALAEKVEVWGVELANGQRVTVASEEQAYAFARQAGSEPLRIARRAQSLIKGTAESVLDELETLHQTWGIDEFIIDTPVADGLARTQSLRLLAQAKFAGEVLA
ncbi:LLM class flavin-dependent oxidoreductase [Lelliottia wanjuensis]|jgi:luciferase family oxidoreductase group 1|uniref:LLM class flavin-dependent oxidoreductase n=1 Tax=Lelliottia wanjuensis TaxID=3050585 RepID=A0AAP4LDG1_9ENTR|nr:MULTISPECIES: LLM class flavin-dependent oxidoreductase [unclassified Lelliottia]MDK9366286.1 LLM class flavin-dependent oxidoreductase [Lelliottia sp. V106_12]MDK9582787.1 LLM class flavin-dependent oxidoreductase [Lelliottia sp. V86_10]MDK9616015.1 LLM class flavin-dependent oxidoreductase [Lelliottia sp. V106_9]